VLPVRAHFGQDAFDSGAAVLAEIGYSRAAGTVVAAWVMKASPHCLFLLEGRRRGRLSALDGLHRQIAQAHGVTARVLSFLPSDPLH